MLESRATVGGKMTSVEHEGFLLNTGTGVLAGSYDTIRDLARDVGLGELPRVHGTLGVVRDGEVHRLRTRRLMHDGLRTKLLSWKSKLLMAKLALDGLRMAPKLRYESLADAGAFDHETTAEYCQRRLNDELWRYLAEPAIRAYSREGTVVEFFFIVRNLLSGGFLGYPGRIDFLARALAETLDVQTNARVLSVANDGGGARVTWRHQGREQVERVDACVLAVPGPLVTKLYDDLPTEAETLFDGPLSYGSVYVGHFGLSRRPDETSMILLLPGHEDPGMYAMAFDHHLRPEAVPPDRGLITTYWEHDWCHAHRSLPREEMIEQMVQSIERFVPDIRSMITFTRIDRWPWATVRSAPGLCAALTRLGELLDPGGAVQLAGDYFSVSSTNSSAKSGELAAARLATRAGLAA